MSHRYRSYQKRTADGTPKYIYRMNRIKLKCTYRCIDIHAHVYSFLLSYNTRTHVKYRWYRLIVKKWLIAVLVLSRFLRCTQLCISMCNFNSLLKQWKTVISNNMYVCTLILCIFNIFRVVIHLIYGWSIQWGR